MIASFFQANPRECACRLVLRVKIVCNENPVKRPQNELNQQSILQSIFATIRNYLDILIELLEGSKVSGFSRDFSLIYVSPIDLLGRTPHVLRAVLKRLRLANASA